ncbi:hypothetical protein N7481_000720 [Penicillium waksmanii]|uniref:uncharacterized protein n=1 Tax=Penicillium waksmanii TaxID=69791 RepID=UPI0025487215|nr:uncharacterized protein N7481_000720 [Penicillium waksmanii]KAJ6000311.1 hypothetical protein N7481_000720 [Penicillium waksmanii]
MSFAHRYTDSNSKPFQCRQCGRSFGRQDVLGRHLRLHTGSSSSTQYQNPTPETGTLQHDQGQAQGTPTPVAMTCLSQVEPAGLSNFPEPHNWLDSDNLLEWLMSDTNGNSTIPLPLVDFPGASSASEYIGLPVPGDLELAQAPQGPGNMALSQIYKLIDDLSRRLNSEVHHSGFTSSFLDACLDEFFKRVSPSFPVIHEQTFTLQKSIPPLLLNMVALGSLFVFETGALEKGEMLWRLGHTAVATSWQTLIETRGPWDAYDGVQLVLTALLGQTYALLSSNSNIRTTASVFHGLGFYWARTSGMYNVSEVLPEDLPTLQMSDEEKNTAWRSWAAIEVQRRAILGHYVLDGLISQASGSPASARHLINRIGTACSDEAFEAPTADEWIVEMQKSAKGNPMSEAFARVFSSNYATNPLQLSHFSIFVIIEGLQSLISDLYEAKGQVFGTVSKKQIIQAMLNIFEGNIMSRSEASNVHHLQVFIRWHSVFIEATAPSISIYRWLCSQFNLPQVLGGVHAKGHLGEFDLHSWAAKADALRATLHAISVTRILDNLPLSQAYTMHIPTAVFTSAVVMTAMCLLNRKVIEVPESYAWSDVWTSQLHGESASPNHETIEEFLGGLNPNNEKVMVSINLLGEINSLQIILKTVASRWGVSAQMNDIIGRLADIARENHGQSVLN